MTAEMQEMTVSLDQVKNELALAQSAIKAKGVTSLRRKRPRGPSWRP